ncbi:MAG: LytTR family DNA-binding domain-containing protein [Pseudomonadota bacterium]
MDFLQRRYVRGAFIVVGMALIFAFLRVYDNGNLNFLERFTMWLTTIGIGAISSLWLGPMVFDKPPTANWSPWLQVPIAAAVIAVPVTLAIILMEASDGTVQPIIFWPIQFVYVFVVSLVITIGGYFLRVHDKAREIEALSPIAAEAAMLDGFMDRLPPKYRRAELHAITSEDHYLRIYTSFGEELILMRLADAVRELSGADGMQVHRSWWVARGGIDTVERENGKPVLVLQGGVRVPVSRTYQPAAKEAGLV